MFEISQAQLIETGLNVAGYLAASALSILMYTSVLNRRHRMAHSPRLGAASTLQAQTSKAVYGGGNAAIVPAGPSKDFISFNEATPASDQYAQDEQNEHKENYEYESSDKKYSRNRAEVIKLARQMLEAGNSAERVSDLLPVSVSEMQLIRLSSGESSGR